MDDSTPLPASAATGRAQQADAAARLRQLWLQGQRPDACEFLAGCGPLPRAEVAAVLRADQCHRWQSGERILAETYLHRHPDLAGHAESALDLIYGEWLLRERDGEEVKLDDFLVRFPQHGPVLRMQVELHQAIAQYRTTEAGDSPATQEVFPHPAAVTDGDTLPHAPSQGLPSRSGGPSVAGYDVLHEVGRGGMGVVYKAWHLPLKRFVALKMLLAGPDAGPNQLARLRTEAEAVARLQHPNIVQIFDVGEVDGRPFLALEYVEGGSLGDRLTGLPQPARPAAALVETLARAVHHAHQHGILHRDLKPANILLQSADPRLPNAEGKSAAFNLQTAVPKITDFGLAKQLSGAPSAPTAGDQTHSGDILGTPGYMAPEQAVGRRGSLGPTADVYSLGAILYQLVTGRPPFQGETPFDTLRQVLAEEPIPPSRLQPGLRPDLETICLKCLQKGPTQRYASAWDLAEDLRRFQAGEPIRAKPVGPLARVGRWCRRRPAVAGLLAALVVVVVGGLGVTTGLWLRAEEARGLAQSKKVEAETNWEESKVDLRLAREGVDEYATRVSNSLKLRQDDLRPLRKELLETVVPFYEKLLARHSDNPDVQAERGEAYARLAKITREIEDPAKACTLYEQAVAVFETLSDQHPDDGNYPVRLAYLRTELSETYQQVGRHDDAESGFLASVKLWQRLLTEHPGEVKYQLGMAQARIGLAGLYGKTERWDVAVAEYQRALEIEEQLERQSTGIPAEQQRAFGFGHLELSLLFTRVDQATRAEDELEQALKIQEELLRRDPFVSDYTQDLSKTRMHRGKLYWHTQRLTEAEVELLEAMRLGEELVRQHPSVLQYPEYLADSRYAFADFYKAIKQPSKAVEELKKAVDLLKALPPAGRDLTTNQARLAAIYDARGDGLLMIGNHPEAALECEKAIRILKALGERYPDKCSYQVSLMNSHIGLGSVHGAARQFVEAEAEFEKALTISKALAPQDFKDREVQSRLSRCHTQLGVLYYHTQRKAKCGEANRKALEIAAELVRKYPDDAYYQTAVAKSHNNLAVLHVDQGHPDEGAEEYRQALEVTRRLVSAHPRVLEYAVMLGIYHANLGILERNTGKLEAALETFALAIKTLEGVLEKEPQHARAKFALCNAHWDRARALMKLARFEKAVLDWDRAVAADAGERREQLRAGRAEAIAQAGDHTRAMAEVEEMAGDKAVQPDILSWLGWVCAHASVAVDKDTTLPAGERADLAERYAARGVALLRQAHGRGHFKMAKDLKDLKTDTGLDPLRQRADFQKLLADVERGAKDGGK